MTFKTNKQRRTVMHYFQLMRLKAYGNVSLKRPLSDSEYNEMFEIAKELGYKK